jgi:putative transcription factor
MRCEMCGKEVPYLKTVVIEGAVLHVCEDCAKFGKEISPKEAKKYVRASSAISERLEIREKKMREKDVLEDEEVLDPEFPEKVRSARMKLGITQEDLARKINEKHYVIAKVEHGELIPDENLRKKLEKTLGINLMVKMEPVHMQKRSEQRRGLTLGDLIKMEK